MNRKSFYSMGVIVLLLSMILAACAPAAAPTAAPTEPPAVETEPPAVETEPPAEETEPPAATTEPAATEPAATEPAATEPPATGDLMKVEAPDCSYTNDGPGFKSIEAIDPLTVKFTMCTSDPAFASKVAFSVFSIADSETLDATTGDSLQLSEPTNGTGPYMVTEWVRGDHITFEANPNYWGDAPAAQTLIFRWSEQSAQRLLELQSGTVDGIDNPAPEDFATIEGDSNLALYNRDPLNVFYVGFNVDLAPFDNEQVRQAFAMAIDKQRIVDDYYPEGSTVAEQFVPPVLQPGFSEGQTGHEYNPDEAKRLLDEAGFDYNQEINLSFRNVVRGYLPTPDKVAQEIQAQLAEIDVNVTLNEMESTTFIDATSAGQEAFYLLGWGADYPDATNFYNYHFANPQNLQFGTLFPDIVEEILAAASLSDAAERQVHYDTVNELLKQHVPMFPVAHGASATAFKASVEGAHSSPLSNEQFSVMDPGADQLVWMQNGEPAALWCSDETDGESLRACEQVYEALLAYEVGGVDVVPALATEWSANEDATEWTFTLREGVQFSDGATFDANDVVASYASQWDASSPNHVGRTGTFEYFGAFFGPFLNAPAE